MKNYAKTLLLVAATCFALVSTSKAQLVTFETISSWTNSVQTFTANQFFAQTFTGVTQVQSMTYRFASSSNSFGPLNLTANFVQWNTAGNTVATAVGTTVQSVGTITIPGSTSWSYDSVRNTYYYDYQIVLNQATSATQTYAMLLQSATNSSIGLSFTNSNAFAYGAMAQQFDATNVGTLPFFDWGFSQLVVAPYVAPTPESGTVAAIAGVVLVAGLVGLRLRQRRQLALAPVTAA